jgi:hypothetical protein
VKQLRNAFKNSDRRSFIKNGLVSVGAATIGVGLLANDSPVFAQDQGREKGSGELTQGDAAILRFLAAAEIIETDFWVQYNELGGIQDKEVQGGTGNKPYTAALKVLDGDMDQYIHDNTEDEFTHQDFINAYLASKGADTVDLSQFVTLPGSTATGSSGRLRLTNLMQLTVDTSWWTRYRSRNKNPDLDPHFKFRQAVPGLSTGQFPAIPRSDADLHPKKHLQAIANTAAFHFPTIEQGGTSLYPALAQRVSATEVLRILLSIGPTETAHFQTWHDKAGNAPPLTDPTNGLVFPDLNKPPFGGQDFKTNLIMPEPCPFLSRNLPVCSIIRPTETKGIAMGVVKFLTDMGLFIGQSSEFFKVLGDLAEDADEASREDKR